MRVVNRVQEREQEEQKAYKERQRIKREEQERQEAILSRTISFKLDRGAFLQFLETMQNGALRRVYGMGACFYNEQITAAQKFFELAIRDRNQIEELIVEGYNPERIDSIKISIDVDSEYVRKIHDEAKGLGIDYGSYLRAIFYTTAHYINAEQRAIEVESQRVRHEDIPWKIKGQISKELRDKLEEKFGPCHWNAMFGTTTYGHFDMLIDLAKEYFGMRDKLG